MCSDQCSPQVQRLKCNASAVRLKADTQNDIPINASDMVRHGEEEQEATIASMENPIFDSGTEAEHRQMYLLSSAAPVVSA